MTRPVSRSLPRAARGAARLVPPALLASLLALALPAGLAAQQPPPPAEAADDDEEPPKESLFRLDLRLAGEEDSNVTLGSGVGIDENPAEAIVDDRVGRFSPELEWVVPFSAGEFGLAGLADFREGNDTDLSEWNALAGARLDFELPAGFFLELSDDYVRTSFDQEIYADPVGQLPGEAGLNEVESNSWRAGVRWQPKERLAASVSWRRRNETVFTDPTTPEGVEREDDRLVDQAEGRLAVPVTQRLLAYTTARRYEQRSDSQPERDVDDLRWVGGLEIAGPSETVFFVEAGKQTIDFFDWPEDFDETVGRIGIRWAPSDDLQVEGAVGRDGFGETLVEVLVNVVVPDESALRFVVRRGTNYSISPATTGPYYMGSLANLSWEKQLPKNFDLRLEGGVFVFETEGAGFLPAQEDTTWRAEAEIGWTFVDDLRVSLYGIYSERNSNLAENEFDGDRIGLSLRYRFEK